MLYQTIIRPLLFTLPPEFIHDLSMHFLAQSARRRVLLKLLRQIADFRNIPSGKAIQLGHLTFKHPVGLAAGFDKNAAALSAWEALGFSFVEAGTITAKAQPGNNKPRVFRIPEAQALINRFGFNNDGSEKIAERLAAVRQVGQWPSIPVGINIGKTKVTPLENAVEDYLFSMKKLFSFADFFTINVSSPNTPGLRELQDKKYLSELLKALQQTNHDLTAQYSLNSPKPVFVKIAPDLQPGQIDEIIAIAIEHQLMGIVATNTTIDKTCLKDPRWHNEAGGLSGKPLADRSTEIIRHISKQTSGKLFVMGVGGIFTRDDVQKKLDAGASLVQVYTGFIYKGPRLVKSLLK